MRQMCKKKPKKQPATANQVAIRISRAFLKSIAQDGLFSGEEVCWTPTLKVKFDTAFRLFVAKNSKVHDATWDLFIEHVGHFTDELWRFKRGSGSLNWSDACLMVERFRWKEA